MRKKIEVVTCDTEVSKMMSSTDRKRKTLCVEGDKGKIRGGGVGMASRETIISKPKQ